LRRIKRLAGMVAILALAGCVEPVVYTPEQRREMETRVFDGTKDLVLRATISVLQDRGYIVGSTDYQMGVVRAESGPKTDFFGETRNHVAVATVEEYGAGKARERITFVREGSRVTRDFFSGMRRVESDTAIISNPEVLRQIYDEIDRELFKRKELDK